MIIKFTLDIDVYIYLSSVFIISLYYVKRTKFYTMYGQRLRVKSRLTVLYCTVLYIHVCSQIQTVHDTNVYSRNLQHIVNTETQTCIN